VRVDSIRRSEKKERIHLKRQVRSRITVAFFGGLTTALLLSIAAYAGAVGDASQPSDQDVKKLGSSTPAERKSAEQRIQKAGAGAIQPLLNGLDDSNPTVRHRAVWLLGQIKYQFKSLPNDMVAREIGRRAHSEKDHKTRFEMVNTLRDYAGPVAVRELKRCALEDPDSDIRVYSIHYAASAALDPSTESAFFKTKTTDNSRAVQLAAYSELAGFGDKSGRDLALQTLKQSSIWLERREAVGVIGATGNPADLPILQGIIDSKSTGADMRLRTLHEYKNIQLSQIPQNAKLDYLINALDDSSWSVRDWAYVRLWKIKDSDTNSRIKKYLTEKGHRGYEEAANALNLR
jgi:HEAT repeat protein